MRYPRFEIISKTVTNISYQPFVTKLSVASSPADFDGLSRREAQHAWDWESVQAERSLYELCSELRFTTACHGGEASGSEFR
jgi:hypothetical protein